MSDKDHILDLLQPYLNDGQFYVVDVQVVGRQGGRIKVTVLLDSDAGITIDECADVGRQLGGRMDELNFFGEAPFTLEVSSPGVDHPLTFPRQYRRHIGRQLVLTLADGATRRGKLESAADDHIILDVETEKKSKSKKKKEAAVSTKPVQAESIQAEPLPVGPTSFAFDQIRKANVEVSFK